MKKFQERYSLRRFRARERLLETLVSCYREAGGSEARPTIAIVDYEEVPTRTEHHLFREFFESKGYPSIVCDPRHLTYEDGRLRHEGHGHRHRLQAPARQRVPGAHRRAAAVPAGGERPGGHDGEPVPLQAHPQEGHLRGADRRRAAAPLHRGGARRHRGSRAVDAPRGRRARSPPGEARSTCRPSSARTARRS